MRFARIAQQRSARQNLPFARVRGALLPLVDEVQNVQLVEAQAVAVDPQNEIQRAGDSGVSIDWKRQREFTVNRGPGVRLFEPRGGRSVLAGEFVWKVARAGGAREQSDEQGQRGNDRKPDGFHGVALQ